MNRSFARLAAAGVTGVTLAASALPAAAVTTSRPQAVCSSASAPAAFATPIYSDRPAIAAAEGLTGTTTVKISLADDGSVASAAVLRSSGAQILDKAALRIIREARYVPETVNCARVPGFYAAEVQFSD